MTADPFPLDQRIASAFSDGAKSGEVATLIKDTNVAAKSAAELAEQTRIRALDPTLSANDVVGARCAMDDAAFRRDRLQTALTKLAERLEQLKDQEENERRQIAYDKVATERDVLAQQLADLYPAFAQKLAELCARVAASDREIDHINKNMLPKGAARLLEVECVARGLPGWIVNTMQVSRVIGSLRLPPWHPRTTYFWPPGRL